MKRFRTTATGAAVGIIAAGLALSSTMAGADVGGDPETILLVERVVKQTLFDEGREGPSAGDHWVSRAELLDGSNDRVGVDGNHCIQTGASGQFLCTLVLRSTDGQITAHGLVRSVSLPLSFDMAISGGTGMYADAGGVVHLEQVDVGSADLTVELTHLVDV